ncbi:MAG: FHA domain-containing protein [Acidobacteriota bacterium]
MPPLQLRLGTDLYPLDRDRVMVGRSRFCDIRLQEDTVSRLHAAFTFGEEGLALQDLGSSNGTFVNGEAVAGSTRLAVGDVVRFGAVRGTIEDSEGQSEPRDLISLSDLAQRPTTALPSGTPAGFLLRCAIVVSELFLFALGSIVPFLPILAVMVMERYFLPTDRLPSTLQAKVIITAACTALWLVYTWYYFIHGWARRGGSPAMRIWGTRLFDWRWRIPIGYGRAWLRAVGVVVSILSFGIGFLLPLFRRDRRALHDLLAGTLVARVRPPLEEHPPEKDAGATP